MIADVRYAPPGAASTGLKPSSTTHTGGSAAAPRSPLWRVAAAPFLRLSPALRVAVVPALIVAAGAALLSWDAGRWAAGQIGIDPGLTWLWPIVVDGMLASGTVGAVAVRAARARTRAYVWALLGAGIGVSVLANAAHAPDGGPVIAGALTLHRIGSAVPALALAATLHLLVIVARVSERAPGAKREARAGPARRARAPRVELPDGRTVSAAHARKLRARARREAAAA